MARTTPVTPPAPARVRRRRMASIVGMWVFIAVFLVGPVLIGSWLFVVPAVGFTVAALATMRLARSPQGPDAEALPPGALKASTARQPVEVHATWTTGGAGRPGSAEKGLLRVAGTRVAFVDARGEAGFDAPVNKVVLASVPGFWRPQLDLEIGGLTHSIRFFPLWDLGATFVGPVVAGEWYAQLKALGAR